ncbi:MAG: cytochrome c [Acidobacteriota bacterium]
MNTATAKWIFYSGTLISALLFLILTWDTHRQVKALTNVDKLSQEVVAGKRAFQKYNCNDCHTILGFGGYYAPDLTKVYSRRGESYIWKVVSQPEIVLASSFRKMPQQNLKPEEIDNLVAFFRWVDEINNNDWPPQDSKTRRRSGVNRLLETGTMSLGAALFKENNCFACHRLQEVGGNVGPTLDDVGSRLSLEKIKQQIRTPESLNPNTAMPGYTNLSDEDLQALATFISQQTGGQQ